MTGLVALRPGWSGLVEAATGVRHGMVPPPAAVPPSAAHVPGIHHASVARDGEPGRSAGGGVARSAATAATAAVAEAIERWTASSARVPLRRASTVAAAAQVGLDSWSLHSAAQRSHPSFPHAAAYPEDEWLTEVHDLATNRPCWVPAALVSLTDEHGALATSSGLAADPSVVKALLRATQELVERDAYVVTWLHQLGGREIPVPDLAADVAPLGGWVRAFDCTQRFSPHPVALVAGSVPLGGAARPSLGVACRSTWAEAVERAYLEMLQGTVFVGHTLAVRPDLVGMPPEAVAGFDEHAVHYGANPDRWAEVPLLRHARPAAPPVREEADVPAVDELRRLVGALRQAGVRLCYRELTGVDADQLGLRVVRVLSPDLAPLHHDHRWPFLGGRTPDAAWRYPDAAARAGGRPFPSPHPHALG
jgi:ribosomal protein S12 methylthiotransferase accessory factor